MRLSRNGKDEPSALLKDGLVEREIKEERSDRRRFRTNERKIKGSLDDSRKFFFQIQLR